jgi:glycosyltransferase involved in cell wall biosynthesis
MAASDLVVHSSTEPEPLGRVVMEAIALETPVIGTSAGGVPEMIRPGETGSLVPPGDVGAMADAISRVLADSTRAAAIARQARAASIQKFGMARSARAIEKLYERVLGLQ